MATHPKWNIEKLSPSAWVVAVSRSRQSRSKHDPTKDTFAEEFVQHARKLVPVDYLDDFGFMDETVEPNNHNISNARIRTNFFDDYIKQASLEHINQAVLLGAGFDTRAFSLDLPKGTIIYELDMPDVINFKQQVISRMHVFPKCTRRTLPIDLREDWTHPLIRCGFNTKAPTAWMAEGLFHALQNSDQRRIVRQVTEMSARGSRIAFQYFSDYTNIVDRYLQSNRAEIAQKVRQSRYLRSLMQLEDADLDNTISTLRSRTSAAEIVPEEFETMGWRTECQTDASLGVKYGIECGVMNNENTSGITTQFVLARLD